MDNVFESIIREFVSTRIEQVVYEVEKTPAYQNEEGEQLKDLQDDLSKSLGADDAEEMINAIRGTSIAIYEHCYLAGLKDGIRINGIIDRLKQS